MCIRDRCWVVSLRRQSTSHAAALTHSLDRVGVLAVAFLVPVFPLPQRGLRAQDSWCCSSRSPCSPPSPHLRSTLCSAMRSPPPKSASRSFSSPCRGCRSSSRQTSSSSSRVPACCGCDRARSTQGCKQCGAGQPHELLHRLFRTGACAASGLAVPKQRAVDRFLTSLAVGRGQQRLRTFHTGMGIECAKPARRNTCRGQQDLHMSCYLLRAATAVVHAMPSGRGTNRFTKDMSHTDRNLTSYARPPCGSTACCSCYPPRS